MTKERIRISILLLIVALAIGSGSVSTDKLTKSKPPVALELGYAWKEGETRNYTLKLESSSEQFVTEKQSIRTEQSLNSEVMLEVREIKDNQINTVIKFINPRISINKEDKSEFRQLFAGEHSVKFNSNGKISNISFNKTKPNNYQVVESVIKQLDFIYLQEKNSWHAESDDSIGNYAAIYKKSGPIVIRAKGNYTTANKEITVTPVKSSTEVLIEPERSWLKSINTNETLNFRENGKLRMTSSTQFILSESNLSPKLNEISAANEIEYQAEQSTIDNPQVKFKAIISKLTTAEETIDLIKYKLELEELLIKEPSLTTEISRLLSDENIRNRPKLALIHSLQQIGSEEAQNLLIELALGNGISTSNRMQAIVSLGQLQKPSEQAIQTLWSIYEQSATDKVVQSAAILNVASAASLIKSHNSASSDSIINKLQELLKLSDTKNSAQTTLILDAIGNSESDRTLEIISPYLSSTKPEVRASAAYALRGYNQNDGLHILLDVAQKDNDANVRNSAVDAISLIKPNENIVAALGQTLSKEENSSVRQSIIRFLGSNREKYPIALSLLKEQLSREQDSQNYESIIGILH